MIDDVVSAIKRYRFTYANEDDLQNGLDLALRHAGFEPQREVRLERGDRALKVVNRVDLLVEGIGIEVKVDGRTARVHDQLARYAQFDTIKGLILVTTRGGRHARFATMREINGKPFRAVVIRTAL